MLSDKYLQGKDLKSFKIMDPTCGVGTLLIESAKRYIGVLRDFSSNQDDYDNISRYFVSHGVIGQDKVDRMVRLTKINALLFGSSTSNISIGNSISATTEIDQYSGLIDLIFTNPPFGADYDVSSLDESKFPHFHELGHYGNRVCSELLMLLKCLYLLKPGGYLAIVLPDSVFSAKGIYSRVREVMLKYYEIRAIVELPAVTFAQAGTRTKTSVCYLRKIESVDNHEIIMAVCNDIGYTVRERTGVPVKILTDRNDSSLVASTYIMHNNSDKRRVLCDDPSVTKVSYKELIDGILNPSFYSSTRLYTLHSLKTSKIDGYTLRELKELVEFQSLSRRSLLIDADTRHISVLHINPDCIIDFKEVEAFQPISKGRECILEDLIFSKINPRIPRMAVVPHYNKRLVCSNEFEIMRPKPNCCIDVYTLCMLLKSTYVTKQIEDLTSGTSSSHSRIKREQLLNILIPYPTSQEAIQSIMDWLH